jgi:hypothetical protein
MANQWFRMYSEFATDPKVQMLSEPFQRRLTMLFCLRCNGNVTLQDEEVTFLLRITSDEWKATKECFISKGFINETNEIINWDKRQFASDTSKNRVAAYRERKKKESNVTVTLQEQNCNAVDTEQNRTDTETEKNDKGKTSVLPFWLPEEKWQSFRDMRKKIKKPMTQEAERLLFMDLEKIRNDGYDPIEAINNSIKSGWQGIFPPNKVNGSHSTKPKSRMDISDIDYSVGITKDGRF